LLEGEHRPVGPVAPSQAEFMPRSSLVDRVRGVPVETSLLRAEAALITKAQLSMPEDAKDAVARRREAERQAVLAKLYEGSGEGSEEGSGSGDDEDDAGSGEGSDEGSGKSGSGSGSGSREGSKKGSGSGSETEAAPEAPAPEDQVEQEPLEPLPVPPPGEGVRQRLLELSNNQLTRRRRMSASGYERLEDERVAWVHAEKALGVSGIRRGSLSGECVRDALARVLELDPTGDAPVLGSKLGELATREDEGRRSRVLSMLLDDESGSGSGSEGSGSESGSS